jgi:hypothetical protein
MNDTTIRALLNAAYRVIENEDDTGCEDDMTVTSKSAVDELKAVVEGYREQENSIVDRIVDSMEDQVPPSEVVYDAVLQALRTSV